KGTSIAKRARARSSGCDSDLTTRDEYCPKVPYAPSQWHDKITFQNRHQPTKLKPMKTKTIITAALISALALPTAHAADITPAEIKTIAQEGFVYGLPIVMGYAVMYEYAVDKGNPEFKAPF